jgi:hypothetical protein
MAGRAVSLLYRFAGLGFGLACGLAVIACASAEARSIGSASSCGADAGAGEPASIASTDQPERSDPTAVVEHHEESRRNFGPVDIRIDNNPHIEAVSPGGQPAPCPQSCGCGGCSCSVSSHNPMSPEWEQLWTLFQHLDEKLKRVEERIAPEPWRQFLLMMLILVLAVASSVALSKRNASRSDMDKTMEDAIRALNVMVLTNAMSAAASMATKPTGGGEPSGGAEQGADSQIGRWDEVMAAIKEFTDKAETSDLEIKKQIDAIETAVSAGEKQAAVSANEAADRVAALGTFAKEIEMQVNEINKGIEEIKEKIDKLETKIGNIKGQGSWDLKVGFPDPLGS